MTVFQHRGVVEGYYGTPWTHADRLWMIDRLGAWGMNRFMYAPKEDQLHRDLWRDPYPAAALTEFQELVEQGQSVGVDVGFALSPGMSVKYSAAADRECLIRKFQTFYQLGSRFFGLFLDDVPTELVHAEDRHSFKSVAAAQVSLVEALQEAFSDDVMFWFVPTEYVGLESTPYLSELGSSLAPEIEVAWAGRTVVSPTIRLDEVAARAGVLQRKVLIWDNIPVNDGPMRQMLHLGPYAGRDAALSEHASGMLLNPMPLARASSLGVRSAARYLEDPQNYDCELAWGEAIAELALGAVEAFRLFAEAHRYSPQFFDDRDRELEGIFRRYQTRPDAETLELLQERVRARLEVPNLLRRNISDQRLLAEIEPWLLSYRRETRRIEAALKVLARLRSSTLARDAVLEFFSMEGRFTLEPENGRVSYGPRRVLYPQLVDLTDERMGFGKDPSLILDRCLADEVVRYAEAEAMRRFLV